MINISYTVKKRFKERINKKLSKKQYLALESFYLNQKIKFRTYKNNLKYKIIKFEGDFMLLLFKKTRLVTLWKVSEKFYTKTKVQDRNRALLDNFNK